MFWLFVLSDSISLLVVSIYVRRNRLDSIQRQNLRRGLSQGLRKALNDTSAQAQVRLLSVLLITQLENTASSDNLYEWMK